MNIGIDIDGVLTDIDKFILEYGSKLCIEEKWPLEIKIGEYEETRIFNWTEEQAEKFWNKYLVYYAKEYYPRIFAQEVIAKLKEEGLDICIITASDETGMPKEEYGKMQEYTRKWLDANNIKYDKLIFAADNKKLGQCLENKIDIMIEDSPKNIQNISSKVPVIKFYCHYNKDINNENIMTAYSWYQIYQIIQEKNK